MQRIYKYPLKVTDEQQVELPRNALLLQVGGQGEQLALWAVVDPESAPVTQTIYVRGTGHPLNIPKTARFLGTAQFAGGSLVFHVFAGTDSDGRQAVTWR